MLNDFWRIKHVSERVRNGAFNRIRTAKLMIFVFFVNPVVMTTGILILHLRPDWAVFPSRDSNLHAILTLFYLVFVFSSCALLYTHLLLHVYFHLHIKLQMEFLIEYFKAIPGDKRKTVNCMQDVSNLLIVGIKQHAKLLK